MTQTVELAGLTTFFPTFSERQVAQLARLEPLYREWNGRINVISRRDMDGLYVHHILHSLAIAKVLRPVEGAQVLDVGTGGGFPGIPLAIAFPQAHFHLVDSIGKKLKVVEAVVEAVGLENVTWQHIRAEELHEQYDFVVSRAVAPCDVLIRWVGKLFLPRQLHDLPNGLLLLKGGDLSAELGRYGSAATLSPVRSFFDFDYFDEKQLVYLPALAL